MIENECPLKSWLSGGEYVYFVHYYAARTERKYVSLFSDYGGEVTGLVFSENIYGAQFHPEKSGDVGLRILKNFGGLK